MLGYEWGNHSPSQPQQSHHPQPQIILTDDLHHDHTSNHHNHSMFDDPYTTPCTFTHDNTPPQQQQQQQPFSLFNFHAVPHFPIYDDPRTSFPYPTTMGGSETRSGFPIMVEPKPEPEFQNRIGLNLGGRTYFAADDDLVSRLYRRSRGGGDQVVNSPKCQAEGCNADLSHAKHYHRRHKVCEFHSKSATVVAAGLTQRFCQQCSRFHLLSEFDNGKRSCRKRLADHNRRRRKSNQSANRDQQENPPKSPSQSIQRSTSDSGANSSSSVTVAISSPLGSFDSNFRQRSHD